MHRILISRKGSYHVLWSEFSFSHITKIWVRKCLSWKKFSLLCCQNLLFYLWIKFAMYLSITFSPLTPVPKFSCEWILRFGGHFFEFKRYTPLGKHHDGGWVVLGRTHVLCAWYLPGRKQKGKYLCFLHVAVILKSGFSFLPSAYQHIRWGTSRLCTIMLGKASLI